MNTTETLVKLPLDSAVWVDAVWAARDRAGGERDNAGPMTAGGVSTRSLLIAVFVFLGAVTLG